MDRLKIPKSDYSQIAKYYDEMRPKAATELVSRLIQYGKIDDDSAVLDVGCGTGRFTLSIPNVKNLFCALDPSIDMLKQAKAKDMSSTVQWIRGDGQNLPFRDNLFNCVYMTAVIHHIENKDLALKEAHRVLGTDGSFVIMTFSHSGLKKHILRDFPGVIEIDLKRVPSVPSLKKTIKMTGFRNVHYHVVQIGEGFVSTDEYLKRVRNKYVSTLSLLSEDEFQRGLRVFEKTARKKYGARIRKIDRFVFLVGKK